MRYYNDTTLCLTDLHNHSLMIITHNLQTLY